MARLVVPLQDRRLRTTGDALLWAELVLDLNTSRGTWAPVPFLVDSGTQMTTMPAPDAKTFDLPIPRRPVPGLTMRGQDVRAGLLRARIVGLDPSEFVFPCYFLGDPDSPPAMPTKILLGLSGVINQIRLCFDGTYALGAPYGNLIVETI
jgi:hypothetical protein